MFWYDSHFCDHAFGMKKALQARQVLKLIWVCVKAGAGTPPKQHGMSRSGHKQVLPTFPFFSETWTGKKGFRAEIWNWTCDSHQLCALEFQRSQLKNVTVNDRQNTVNMRQNGGKWRHLPSKYRQNGLFFFARHFAVTFSGFQGVLQHGPNSCWVV